ncbi:hypothetical protein PVBG_05465 [Plasmodium vivax Brazil I]|uniref:Uncharacterized protein n=1 Tax=Plasmodium vivax (strain Brazil I) TaxID=1033975 RepID=A0A0J9ST88_PLAV1|nr:hypothetical protein PVBG_05465 [Plasmodium vivax Brazil I]
MKNSNFYKIYDEFSKGCTTYRTDNDESCYKKVEQISEYSSDVNEILKDLYSMLYRIYATLPGTNNTYFEDVELNDEKLGCLCLKYWLYDQIILKGFSDSKILDLFVGWKTYVQEKIEYGTKKKCIFNNLNKDEINKIKNIYSLYAVLNDNSNNYENCSNDNCKYLEYFGEGLDEFINSINKCSNKEYTDNYCNEFKEFLNLCKDTNEHAGISIYDESTKTEDGTAGEYLLSVETYDNKPHYIYLKDKEMLNFLKTSNFLSNKSTTIAATSVVGSAIGLSSIFYYLYKVIPNDILKYKYCILINIKYVIKILL